MARHTEERKGGSKNSNSKSAWGASPWEASVKATYLSMAERVIKRTQRNLGKVSRADRLSNHLAGNKNNAMKKEAKAALVPDARGTTLKTLAMEGGGRIGRDQSR